MKRIINIICLLSCLVCFFGCSSKQQVTTKNPVTKKPEEAMVHENGNFTQRNAYEYIMEVMTSPQLWSKEQRPPYNLEWDEEDADKVIVNGTGWKLEDEKTATFTRGYQGTLTINFSNFTAKSNVESKNSWYGTHVIHEFDYNTNEFFVTTDDYRREYRIVYTYDEYHSLEYPKYNQSWYVKDLMLMYDSLFKDAGCPLLNQPEGTLESYRNLTVYVPERKDDGKIHYIWQQEGFKFDWTNNKDNVWLKDYRSIFDQPVEPSEPRTVTRKDSWVTYYPYSPLFLVIVDRDISKMYLDRNYKTAIVWRTLRNYTNYVGGIATYFLAPAMREIYGYDGAFFYEVEDMPQKGTPIQFGMSEEEFKKKGAVPIDDGIPDNHQEIVTIYKEGEISVGNIDRMETNWQHYYELFEKVMSMADYYGRELPYANDWFINMQIYYSIAFQRELGLR